jgi:hypothetical protein
MSVTRLASTSRAQESCAAICAPTSSSPCAPAGKARPSDSAGAAGPARHEAGPGRPPRTGQLGGPLSDSVHSNWPDRVRSSPARRPSFGERDRREGPRLVAVGARTTRKLDRAARRSTARRRSQASGRRLRARERHEPGRRLLVRARLWTGRPASGLRSASWVVASPGTMPTASPRRRAATIRTATNVPPWPSLRVLTQAVPVAAYAPPFIGAQLARSQTPFGDGAAAQLVAISLAVFGLGSRTERAASRGEMASCATVGAARCSRCASASASEGSRWRARRET